ncbi:MAG: hypothetical protein IKG39_12025 [Lachnospiraceae bacterium]|nr:hypothetical protein [Lachnospiraceae bacterium]
MLEHCGVNVTGTYLVVLNNEYIFDGTLKLDELFKITDVSEEVANETGRIEYNLAIAEKILNNPEEPDIDLFPSCNDPYRCAFWNYCAKDVPSPSVFDLYRLQFKKKIEYYRKGMVTYAGCHGRQCYIALLYGSRASF